MSGMPCIRTRKTKSEELKKSVRKFSGSPLLLLSLPKRVHPSMSLTFHTEIGFPSSSGSQRGALTAYEEPGCGRQLAADLLSSTQRGLLGKSEGVRQELSRSAGAIAEL